MNRRNGNGNDCVPVSKKWAGRSGSTERPCISFEPQKQVAAIVMKGGGHWTTSSPGGSRCYITERIENTVAVIDTDNRKTILRIAVGSVPKRVLFVTLPGQTHE